MRITILAALVAALVVPAWAGATTVPVQQLTPPFEASNSTVTKTPDGVHYGTYADGGALGGSLTFHGLDGQPLSSLTDYSYTFSYRQAGATTGAAPYARVFLDNGDGGLDDVILDPSFCATTTPDQATWLTYQMVGNSVRYDDDSCDGTLPDQQPWADVVEAHGDQTIVGLLVSQGFSTGTDVSALLRNITVNGTTYAFDVPPQDGNAGAQGPAGAPGDTTVVQVPAAAAPAVRLTAATRRCQGNTVRALHAPTRPGEKFLSVRATLRGKHLATSGRTIRVDLRDQDEANYNVRLTSRYRTAAGNVRHVKTTRNLSVVCS